MITTNSSPNTQLSITVVQNLADFYSLHHIWDRLAQRQQSYGPWLNHEWFSLYMKNFLDHNELLIITVHQNAIIKAIAPFYVTNQTIKGIIPLTVIQLIGNHYSPIRTFLFDDSVGNQLTEVIEHILNYFIRVYKKWDILELQGIPQKSNTISSLNRALHKISQPHWRNIYSDNRFLNDINYPFSKYFHDLPKKIKKDIKYCENRLRKMGSTHFKMVDDINDLDHYLDLYDFVRAKSWKAPEADKEFHRDFIKLAARKGWMRIGFLYHQNLPIAAQKWVVWKNVAFILDVLYDEDFKKYSPGKILLSKVAEHVIDKDGVTEIDFMIGDEPYKTDWTPKLRHTYAITIFNRTIKSFLYRFGLTKVKPLFTNCKNALQ